jgi:hypothetical protein
MLNNQARVSVTMEGLDRGVFRGREGGAKTGESTSVRPGGMAPPKVYAGTWEFDEVTLTRVIEHGTDSGLYHWFLDRYGQRLTAIEQPLDGRGRAGFHRPVTYGAVLTGIAQVDYDADGNDPWTLVLTVRPDGIS